MFRSSDDAFVPHLPQTHVQRVNHRHRPWTDRVTGVHNSLCDNHTLTGRVWSRPWFRTLLTMQATLSCSKALD